MHYVFWGGSVQLTVLQALSYFYLVPVWILSQMMMKRNDKLYIFVLQWEGWHISTVRCGGYGDDAEARLEVCLHVRAGNSPALQGPGLVDRQGRSSPSRSCSRALSANSLCQVVYTYITIGSIVLYILFSLCSLVNNLLFHYLISHYLMFHLSPFYFLY